MVPAILEKLAFAVPSAILCAQGRLTPVVLGAGLGRSRSGRGSTAMWLASVEGSAAIRADRRSFLKALQRRVEVGLLAGRPEPRSRYVVTQRGRDRLAFCAADWPTAINVGLNDVEIEASASGRVHYAIRYARWAGYAVALCGVIGGTFIAFLLLFDLRTYLSRQADRASLGLPAEQSVTVAWGMALFWGFVWPWLLVALHRRPVRRLMEPLIGEVDSEARHPSAEGARVPGA